jgi:hypothetical protein
MNKEFVDEKSDSIRSNQKISFPSNLTFVEQQSKEEKSPE